MGRWIRTLVGASMLAASSAALHGQPVEPEVSFLKSHDDSIRIRHFSPEAPAAKPIGALLVPGWPAVGKDVLGLGAALSSRGTHVFLLHPRGHGESGGEATFSHALEDVATVWSWMASREGGGALGITPERRVIIGYSWGGGIALAFAAREPSVKRVVSIAGSDHGAFIRRVDSDAEYGSFMRRILESTRAPAGPVRFDVEKCLEELRVTHGEHDLVSIAPKLLDRDILIVAGWDDEEVEIERQVLPFYRALQKGGAGSVRMLSFQDGHGFQQVRKELVEGVVEWIGKEP